MLNKTFAYPYDPYGTNPECKVVFERHTITPINGTDLGIVIPKAAPFFRKSVKLRHVATNRDLIDGVDWEPGFHFDAASSQKPYLQIFGCIVIKDTALSGTIEITEYQTLGGEFTLDETTLLELLANTQIDPRMTTWDSVEYRPLVFDAAAHLQSADTTVGYDEMVEVLRQMAESNTVEYSKIATALLNHIQDHSNPHEVNAQTIGLQRFVNVYRATLEQVLAGKDAVNYVTSDNLAAKIAQSLLDMEFRGLEGQSVFFDSTGESFGIESDWNQNSLNIVHDEDEWAYQSTVGQSGAEMFKTWRRLAWQGNNPVAIPGELQGWTYEEATDRVLSSINSSTYISLVSPDVVDADYVFEVELSSLNSDDDFIGLFLGQWVHADKQMSLYAMRSATNQTTEAGGRPKMRLVLNGNEVLANLDNIGATPANGWATYTQPVKLRVRRVGTVIYLTTNEPGGAYKPEISFDLASRADTVGAAGRVNLGYSSFSQPASTWKTLQRTGSRPALIGLHNNKVALWDGTQYIVNATKTPADYILAGRYYRNPTFMRTYFAASAGSPVLISQNGAVEEISKANNTWGKLAHTDGQGNTHVGQSVNLHSATARLGGLKAETNKVGITKPDGSYYAYFGADGKLQHYGLNHASDMIYKDHIQDVPYVDDTSIRLHSWNWKRMAELPEHLWGKEDSGVLAQRVLPLYPHCVSRNADGHLSVDYGKLAVSMYLNQRNKPTLWQWIKAKIFNR